MTIAATLLQGVSPRVPIQGVSEAFLSSSLFLTLSPVSCIRAGCPAYHAPLPSQSSWEHRLPLFPLHYVVLGEWSSYVLNL